jgi:hypothetical protein
MKSLFIGYVAALATLVVLDALWLGVVSRDFYKARLGQLLLDQPNWPVAILFYLIHAVGIVVFPVLLAAYGFRPPCTARCSASSSMPPMISPTSPPCAAGRWQ